MPQMLFPAASADPVVTGNSSRAGTGRSGIGDSGKTDASRFDQVNRAERERMEQQLPSQSPEEQEAAAIHPEHSGQDAAAAADSDTAEDSGEPDPGDAPVTFAVLQPPATVSEGKGPAPEQSATGYGLSLILTSSGRVPSYTEAALQQMAMADNPDASGLPLPELTDPVSRAGISAGSRQPVDALLPLPGYTTSVELPVGHARWGDQVIGKLTWLTARNLSEAEIHLTPPDMGPLEVKVRVQHDQASITVHAANPVVRDQLELHSHRLRDMLEQQGLALQQFDVSGQSGNQTGRDHAGADAGPESVDTPVSAPEETEPALIRGSLDLGWTGEVDVFA